MVSARSAMSPLRRRRRSLRVALLVILILASIGIIMKGLDINHNLVGLGGREGKDNGNRKRLESVSYKRMLFVFGDFVY